jgi:hypothetical protein
MVNERQEENEKLIKVLLYFVLWNLPLLLSKVMGEFLN